MVYVNRVRIFALFAKKRNNLIPAGNIDLNGNWVGDVGRELSGSSANLWSVYRAVRRFKLSKSGQARL